MSPTPLSPSTVHVLLQYISPPSQLDQPLPPYLLSKALLQRHHFLGISPEDPREYLCWSTAPDKSSEAIRLLESSARPFDEDAPQGYTIHYSADDEHVYAHASLSATQDGVRLVFQWDEPDGWKYHDASMMPFPPNSRPSLRDTISVIASAQGAESIPRVDIDPYSAQPDDEGDDDDYWNAYGAQDSHEDEMNSHLQLSAKDTDTSEDAYWARYASVHGTADSTRPSPLPLHRRRPGPLDRLPSHPDPDSPHPLPVPVRISSEDTAEDALPIPANVMPQIVTNPRWDPASPRTLARLLATISPRESASQSPAQELASQIDFLSPAEESSGTDDPPTPSALGLVEDDIPDATSSVLSPSREARSSRASSQATSDDNHPFAQFDAVDQALHESIRGIYNLWQMNRPKREAEGDKTDIFLRIVQNAVESL